jgi:AmmeMemoRadiSam system protein B
MSQSPLPGGQPLPQAQFDPSAPHHQRPALRPVRGFPVQANGQVMLGLTDARQVSDKMVLAPMAVQQILPLLSGERTIGEIVAEVGHGLTEDNLQGFVAQLDEAGLLVGPKFDAILAKMREDFDSHPILPAAATLGVAEMLVMQKHGQDASEELKGQEGPGMLREAMDEWIKQSLASEAAPSFDELPKGIIAPHIDYPRGWMNYASVWGRMRVVDRPDRVVILGTNHFGMSTGVAVCDKGFETPFGVSNSDPKFVDAFKKALGADLAKKAFANRYDHEREHSIELQVAWIQHCLGKDDRGDYCPVFAALIHDPAVNNGESYDNEGVGLMPFVDAVRAAIREVGGRTLVVSSADLSHVGPMFGDQQPMHGEGSEVEQARNRVVMQDQELLQHVMKARPDDLVASMAWLQNPTRWCSTGNIVAALKIVQPERVDLLRYLASVDQNGMGMVSSIAAVMR